MKCPLCKTELPADCEKCPSCGYVLPESYISEMKRAERIQETGQKVQGVGEKMQSVGSAMTRWISVPIFVIFGVIMLFVAPVFGIILIVIGILLGATIGRKR